MSVLLFIVGFYGCCVLMGCCGEFEWLRRVLVRVAGEVAGFLRDRFGVEEYLVVETLHGEDYGMKADVEAEDLIVELLKSEGLSGWVIGEERGVVKIRGGGNLYFVVDPLDGSKNYAVGVPWCAVSIAALVNGEGRVPSLGDVVAGAIAPIFGGPILSFARGVGVFEGGALVHVRREPPAKMLLTYVEAPEQARLLRTYLEMAGRRSVRSLGSASLEIAWAALGRVEAFIDLRGKLRPVDVAAAVGLAVELGAYVAVTRAFEPVTKVRRVGYVAVTAFDHAWNLIRKTMTSYGLEDPVEHLITCRRAGDPV